MNFFQNLFENQTLYLMNFLYWKIKKIELHNMLIKDFLDFFEDMLKEYDREY